jgi:hypothetical protein
MNENGRFIRGLHSLECPENLSYDLDMLIIAHVDSAKNRTVISIPDGRYLVHNGEFGYLVADNGIIKRVCKSRKHPDGTTAWHYINPQYKHPPIFLRQSEKQDGGQEVSS